MAMDSKSACAVKSPDGRKVKCEVRLLDTVFLDESSGKVEGGDWLFTSKHGTVTLKKQEQVTVQKVVDRFGRFAMMNPLNTDQFVARLLPSEQNAESSSGDGRLLNLAELEGFLASSNGSEKGVALQVFLRPRDGGWRGSWVDSRQAAAVRGRVKVRGGGACRLGARSQARGGGVLPGGGEARGAHAFRAQGGALAVRVHARRQPPALAYPCAVAPCAALGPL
eukprot:CAMPEP_0171811734 /NCGR_PEP_ID=MMETSP0991-20121206/78287_1 /TAXON_ID=483369 /ORGANISM="non described non described, Strain CCMP2098" /LENGTH=222 /DNA_ID=CAMNT_0012425163 /DNA_START=15 /DNA_END=681 /DNA_ORIENTATION=+